MDDNLLIIILLSIIVVFGFLLGWLFARIIIARKNKKIMDDLIKVLKGEKENFIEVDGIKYPANKFKLRDEKGKEKLVDLKGGVLEENAKKNTKEERKEVLRKNSTNNREDSRSIRKKKRITRTRNGRIRRFG